VRCHLPGDILTLSVTNDLGARIALLFAYVLGLGPAILARRRPGRPTLLRRLQRRDQLVNSISGLLLIGVSAALLLG